jgi:heme/copper-type cytochrome/quinol oxidase subunit 3
MSVKGSRFARPISPGAADAQTIGWWAMLLGLIALANFVGGIIVAYLYLRVGHAEWPPPGFDPPPLTLAGIAVGLTAVAALLATLEVRWTASRGPVGMAGAIGAMVAGSVAAGLHVASLLGAGVMWDDHAYGSLLWLLGGTATLLVAAGVIGSAAILTQHAMGDYGPDRHDEIRVLSLYWWFAVAGSAALYVTAYLVPHL